MLAFRGPRDSPLRFSDISPVQSRNKASLNGAPGLVWVRKDGKRAEEARKAREGVEREERAFQDGPFFSTSSSEGSKCLDFFSLSLSFLVFSRQALSSPHSLSLRSARERRGPRLASAEARAREAKEREKRTRWRSKEQEPGAKALSKRQKKTSPSKRRALLVPGASRDPPPTPGATSGISSRRWRVQEESPASQSIRMRRANRKKTRGEERRASKRRAKSRGGAPQSFFPHCVPLCSRWRSNSDP